MLLPEQQITDQLDQYLQKRLAQKGAPLTFAEWMEAVLYAPQWGYYYNLKPKFGTDGDFITAPNYSPLFGQCLTTQLIEILDELPQKNILEIGPGNGILAKSILKQCETEQYTIDNYFLVETSPSLQQSQKEQLADLKTPCHWLAKIPEGFIGVVIANEVIDALPAERFCVIDKDHYHYEGVTYKDGTWQWQTMPVPIMHQPFLTKLLESNTHCLKNLPYRSEYRPELSVWIKNSFQSMQQGVILLIDYGYREAEYYHPERNQGSLTCFYRHTKHNNPFLHIGLQDISVHVNFTAVLQAAQAIGLECLGFCTQANFLINTGILDCFNPNQDSTETLQKLIHPAEMGECVKVMALGKQWTDTLSGFIGKQSLL